MNCPLRMVDACLTGGGAKGKQAHSTGKERAKLKIARDDLKREQRDGPGKAAGGRPGRAHDLDGASRFVLDADVSDVSGRQLDPSSSNKINRFIVSHGFIPLVCWQQHINYPALNLDLFA